MGSHTGAEATSWRIFLLGRALKRLKNVSTAVIPRVMGMVSRIALSLAFQAQAGQTEAWTTFSSFSVTTSTGFFLPGRDSDRVFVST